MSGSLFSPTTLGRLSLRNRVVMAPMTRNRALGNVPGPVMATFYGQRSEAGLLITEGTAPTPDALGYARMPGVFSDAQVAGWRAVTSAVHEGGSRIFIQLMHSGRVGHPANLPAGARLLGPSAIAAPGVMFTDSEGPQPHPVPEVMSDEDIEAALASFASAALRAMEAGFDGVELHGANGYLIEQFLNTAANARQDRWGGSIEGRIRFAVEAARRTAAAIGPERVGMRLSPFGVLGGMSPDPATAELYTALAAELSALGLVYLHVVDHSAMGTPPVPAEMKAALRATFRGAMILCGGYDAARAEADLSEGKADLIAFGRPFIANPRLVSRMRAGLPLAQPDHATFYTPGERGYTDYPLE